MDRYQKVEKPKPELPIKDDEIRITSQGLVRNYISYATTLLQERQGKEIVLKAMGQAISKTVAIAEIIKRRTPQLHQDTTISSVSVTDVWEPIEEGLLPVEQTRQVSMITITLSTKELNTNSPGYQAPSKEQGRLQYNYRPQQQQQEQPPRQRAIYNVENEGSYSRGRGNGRGRGRVWNRGGYTNYQESGGYSSSVRGGGYGYRDNGRYSNWGRGGGYGYGGSGYARGRGGGGRGRGRGRMGPHTRGGGNQE